MLQRSLVLGSEQTSSPTTNPVRQGPDTIARGELDRVTFRAILHPASTKVRSPTEHRHVVPRRVYASHDKHTSSSSGSHTRHHKPHTDPRGCFWGPLCSASTDAHSRPANYGRQECAGGENPDNGPSSCSWSKCYQDPVADCGAIAYDGGEHRASTERRGHVGHCDARGCGSSYAEDQHEQCRDDPAAERCQCY